MLCVSFVTLYAMVKAQDRAIQFEGTALSSAFKYESWAYFIASTVAFNAAIDFVFGVPFPKSNSSPRERKSVVAKSVSYCNDSFRLLLYVKKVRHNIQSYDAYKYI